MSDDSGKTQDMSDSESKQPGADEVFCMECGEIIKERAEVCPECGVRQKDQNDASDPEPVANQHQQGGGSSLTDRRQYELEKIAGQSKMTVVLAGLLITPLGYWMIGKKGLALANFLTLNFFLLGFIIVPIHCYSMMTDAEEELRRAGVGGY